MEWSRKGRTVPDAERPVQRVKEWDIFLEEHHAGVS